MLYILWRHLQYYLVHCKPVDPDISLGVPGIDRSGLRRLQGEVTWNVLVNVFVIYWIVNSVCPEKNMVKLSCQACKNNK